MIVGPFWKKFNIPPDSIDGCFVIAILPVDSGSFQVWRHIFFIDHGDAYFKKSLKSVD